MDRLSNKDLVKLWRLGSNIAQITADLSVLSVCEHQCLELVRYFLKRLCFFLILAVLVFGDVYLFCFKYLCLLQFYGSCWDIYICIYVSTRWDFCLPFRRKILVKFLPSSFFSPIHSESREKTIIFTLFNQRPPNNTSEYLRLQKRDVVLFLQVFQDHWKRLTIFKSHSFGQNLFFSPKFNWKKCWWRIEFSFNFAVVSSTSRCIGLHKVWPIVVRKIKTVQKRKSKRSECFCTQIFRILIFLQTSWKFQTRTSHIQYVFQIQRQKVLVTLHLSQHVCEACGQAFQTEKDIPSTQ